MALEKYVKSLGKQATPCEMCKDKSFGERFRWRSQQIIPSYKPSILTVCKKCLYRENYGTKNYRKAMKENLEKDVGNA
tara:strand:+ start:131 stop:364 length:234 start_codon:yes stop_codon:yes gene_type:complete